MSNILSFGASEEDFSWPPAWGSDIVFTNPLYWMEIPFQYTRSFMREKEKSIDMMVEKSTNSKRTAPL